MCNRRRVSATRVGPRRLISTALSSGESKLTVAAEWITVEHEARVSSDGAVEPQAVDAHVARHHEDPPVHLGVEPVAELAAQPVEAVVPEDLAAYPVRRAAPAGPHEQGDLAVGNASQQSFGQGGPEEAGGAGDGDSAAGQGLGEHR